MTKLPVVTSNEVIRGLKKAGFVFDRQGKGSHEIGIILLPKEGLPSPIILGWRFTKEL